MSLLLDIIFDLIGAWIYGRLPRPAQIGCLALLVGVMIGGLVWLSVGVLGWT